MNAYHAVPNCLDMKGAMDDGLDSNSRERLHHHRSGIYQTFLGRYIPRSPNRRLMEFAEAASSPAKYAVFQFCGHAFINSIGVAYPLIPLTSPLKIGAFGGVILAFFYFALLLRKRSMNRLNYEDSASSYVVNLIKEIMYSVLAAYLGVKGCGHRDEMRLSMLAGALGPIVATTAIVTFLCLVVGIVCSVERFRNWRAGY